MSSATRRKFLQGAAAVAGVGTFGLGADGLIIEPNHPQLIRVDVSLTRLPAAFDGFTIVQLSDFHYDDHFSVIPLRKSIEIANTLHPDIIVLTGDFVTVPLFTKYFENAKRAARSAEPCALLLSELRSKASVFAVLGNHDVTSDHVWITEIIERQGIPVLRNSSVPIDRNGARIWLAGIDDVLEGKPDLAATLRLTPANELVILLSHEPDFANVVSHYPIDLQLSGHSHGGQIRLPLIGAPWLPALGREYPRGLYHVGRLTLYTNIGLGTIRIPVRLNCPPEITLLTLRRAVSA